MELVIVGCGNPLLGDDGVGLEVVRRLSAAPLPPGVRVVEAGLPGLTLLDIVHGYRQAVIVDAVMAGLPPGEVLCFSDGELPPPGYSRWSLHGVGLVEALKLGRLLGDGFPEQLTIYGIQVGSVNLGEGLSPPVLAAVETVVDRIGKEVLVRS